MLAWAAECRTAIVTILAVYLAGVVVRFVRRLSASVRLLAHLTAALACALTVVVSAGVFAVVGRTAIQEAEMTLTGRVLLWSTLLNFAKAQPWLGYGYFGFWFGIEQTQHLVAKDIGWSAPHAHNGFLDLQLSFGILGSLILVAVLVTLVRKALRERETTVGLWSMLLVLALLIQNLSESSLLQCNLASVALLFGTLPVVLGQLGDGKGRFVRLHANDSQFGGRA